MRRAIAYLLSSFIFLTGYLPSIVNATEADRSALTAQEARQLSDSELASRLVSALFKNVVDVDRAPLSDETMDEVGVGLRPTPGWKGMCEAQIVQFEFPEIPGSKEEPKFPSSLRVTTRYKVRSNPDENSTEDIVEATTRCGKDRPFKDAYFTAPDARLAQNAGHIVETAQAQARAGKRSFIVECAPRSLCKASLARIEMSSTDRIAMVTEPNRCPDGRACVEITFFNEDRCWENWSVIGIYKTPPGQRWGMIVPTNIRMKIECPGPAL